MFSSISFYLRFYIKVCVSLGRKLQNTPELDLIFNILPHFTYFLSIQYFFILKHLRVGGIYQTLLLLNTSVYTSLY